MPSQAIPGSSTVVCRHWQRSLLATSLALAICSVDSLCALNPVMPHQTCQSGKACQHLAKLDFGGKQACASLPVDFKRAAQSQASLPVRAQAAAPGPYDQLHSRPAATKKIYLDFNGHTTQNTPWSTTPIVTTAYDSDGNPSSFSTTEQANITEIWQRVAECYSPFDVDVTTQAPSVADLINTGGSDTKWGIRVLFGNSNPSPAPGAGGVAYVDAFGWGTNGVDVPCFVLQDGVGTNPKFNADAATHEVGHVLGLSHDGKGSESYYEGQGTGKVAWAPHMGVGYYVPLVQWSKGEYANPTNREDDLNIITTHNGFGYRPDDFASTQTSALAIPGTAGATTFAVNASGVIETRTDTDWFKITCTTGPVQLNAVGGPANTMLDIQLSLYNSAGSLVASANPADDVVATINQTITGGTYYLKIEGVGLGDPTTTGYTDYSSIGQYTITGSYTTSPTGNGVPVLANPANLYYGISQAPKNINAGITVTDSNSATLASATVKITNVVPSQDVLSLTTYTKTMGNITASYNSTIGTLTLTSAGATATVVQFQNALRSVCYKNSSLNPTTTARVVEFRANDGSNTSNVLTSNVKIGYFYVNAVYDSISKTLTLTDDAGDNTLNISVSGGTVSVQGTGATKIGKLSSSQTTMTFPYAGELNLVGNFSIGSDTIKVTGVKSTTATFNLGSGNDTLNVTLCNITGLLTVDGGPGTDVFTKPGSTVASQSVTNVP